MVKSISGQALIGSAAALALMAGTARADYPGALWSVDSVRVTGAAGEMAARVGAGLRQANDTYFHGDRAVTMSADVSDGRVRVTVTDRLTGAMLARTGALAVDGDLHAAVLDWMGTLECTSIDCAPDAGGTQLAAAPLPKAEAAPVRAPDALTTAASEVRIAKASAGIPVPQAKPAQAIDLAGLDRTRIARTPDLGNAEPIRIARFNTQGIAGISYSAADPLVIASPAATAVAPSAAVAQTQQAGSTTLVGRWLSGLAQILGVGSTTAATAAPRAAAVQTAAVPQAAALPTAAAPSGDPFRPSAQWRPAEPATQAPAATENVRLAALAPTTLPRPAAAAPAAEAPTTYTGLRVVPSPGLRLPQRRTEESGAVVTPIRVASVAPAAIRAARTRNDLSVRIDPEVLERYTGTSINKIFGSYGNRNAKVRLVATGEGTDGESVDRILAARGLALDSERFARAERVFWDGQSGSRGFWISMPTAAPSKYVLIASSKASVIAEVYSSGSSVRVSDAVAKALGMQTYDWSDVQVIALKEATRTTRLRKRRAIR